MARALLFLVVPFLVVATAWAIKDDDYNVEEEARAPFNAEEEARADYDYWLHVNEVRAAEAEARKQAEKEAEEAKKRAECAKGAGGSDKGGGGSETGGEGSIAVV
jgi:hypothetical protein